jgi:hypothetical protein
MTTTKSVVDVPDAEVQGMVFNIASCNRDCCFVCAKNDWNIGGTLALIVVLIDFGLSPHVNQETQAYNRAHTEWFHA